MYDLIIVGGGPAGLTATIYAARQRLNVLLIASDLGGKTNYRLQLPQMERHLVIDGEDVVNQFANEISYLDFTRVTDAVLKIEKLNGADNTLVYKVQTRGGTDYTARAILIATGARPRRLEVPGEQEFLMRGLSYSALSYAPLMAERVVAVVGASELALRATADLARLAKQVILVAPSEGDLDSALGQRVKWLPNVSILAGYSVTRVEGLNFAQQLILSRNGNVRELSADAIFIELGLIPNSGLVADLVERDDEDRIRIDSRNRTSAPGIFAAGDVTDVYAEQVLIAIGEGAKAALSAHDYLLTLPITEPILAVPSEWR